MARGRPAVLVIDEAFANIKDSGKRIRTASILEVCARSFEITYVAYVGNQGDAEAAEATWKPRGVHVVPVASPPVAKHGIAQIGTAAKVLWRRLPASVAAWRTTGFQRAVAATLASQAFDLVHCEITQMAWSVPFDCGLPTVLNAHNVETIIWERLAEVQGPGRRWLFRNQAAKMARFEREYLPRFDQIMCVSDLDRQRMASRFGVTGVRVLPNGVASTIPVLPASNGPPLLLYPGALDWRPSQDGAAYLLQEILPLVRARIPDVRVAVVGKGPPDWLRALCTATQGAECHGDVPDMQPYYERARIVVVPLRVGSGSRLRILEALAYGRAVVSTSIGAEGLAIADGTHLDLADGTEQFADAICRLLGDEARRESYMSHGRRAVELQYQWEGIGSEAADLWMHQVDYSRGLSRPAAGVRT